MPDQDHNTEYTTGVLGWTSHTKGDNCICADECYKRVVYPDVHVPVKIRRDMAYQYNSTAKPYVWEL